ncbi:hypothetical protein MRB53_033397 [Persea americana]|uniref:Uncharacterized protein n=2 Tax=Persea americana TaxID=3435 RepID=A0ACC2KUM8_PERAE|nr:hypothetical protein MRB53_033385 [Persea americana]KAJ8624867.1 hypothetical protein MRB53_033397 [Persea americana]
MERSCDNIRTFTQHYRRSERRETGNCSITAAPIGGKVDFPVFLRSERRKAGNYSFTAALVGGKPDFPVFLLSKRRKTRNSSFPPLPSAVKSIFQFSSALRGGKLEIAFTLLVHVAESFQSDSLSFFPFLCSSVGHGSGLSSTK